MARSDRTTDTSTSSSDTIVSKEATQKSSRTGRLWKNRTKQADAESSSQSHKASSSIPLRTNSQASGTKSSIRRLGQTVIWFLISGNLLIAGALGFWGFLWHSNNSNSTWHSIVAGDHIKVIITVTSDTVKALLGSMIGAECSMLVALALEKGDVFFPNLASAATGRKGLGGTKWTGWIWKLVRGKWPSNGLAILLPFMLIFISLVDLMSLSMSTVLISDINLGTISSGSGSTSSNYGFQYRPDTITSNDNLRGLLDSGSVWDRRASAYPAFAEYSEPPFVKEGVSDTGLTLRAFLPFDNTTQRGQLHEYRGKTMVVDTRVTCQVPTFTNLTIDVQDDALLFSGFVAASIFTPRLDNNTEIASNIFAAEWQRHLPVPFLCTAPLFVGEGGDLSNQWRTSLCQLSENQNQGVGVAGGLVSEFKDYDVWIKSDYNASYQFGTAYLIFNISNGVEYLWQEVYGDSRTVTREPTYLPDNAGLPAVEWLQYELPEDLAFGSTLCYSAFDTADLDVSISTTTQRNTTEPTPTFNYTSLQYSFPELRRQYGQNYPHTSLQTSQDQRGIYTLAPQSWIAPPYTQPPIEPWLRQLLNLASGLSISGNDPGYTAFLCQSQTYINNFNTSWYTSHGFPDTPTPTIVYPNANHIWFFQEILATGGSITFAIQSLITLLSSMAYYDQLGQFDAVASVDISTFKITNIPTRSRGWLSITILLVTHLIVSWILLIWFLRSTRYSLLDESWSQLAQAMTEETKPFLEKAVLMTDDEVKLLIDDEGLKRRRVKLGPKSRDGNGGERVAIHLVKEMEEIRVAEEEKEVGYGRWPHLEHRYRKITH